MVDNGDEYLLSLSRHRLPEKQVKGRRPVVIVPGYGMNSFIFGFHPRGLSLIDFLLQRGFEVWTADLRCQGESACLNGRGSITLASLALIDLQAVFSFIVGHSSTGCQKVDALGCSLGGSLLYAYLACVEKNPVGSLVAIGAPLRWERVHPLVKMVFASPALVGLIPIRGTRKAASVLLPLLFKVPAVLKPYLHPDIVDTTRANELVNTVEDPIPRVNRDIAMWMKRKDLIMEGINVTEALSRRHNPLLCVLANADGIVPDESALAAIRAMGGPVRDILKVGHKDLPMAHADLFISDHAQEMVFAPLANWLERQSPP